MIMLVLNTRLLGLLLPVLLLAIAPQVQAGDLDGIKLHWRAPQRYTNNERLIDPRHELKEYRLYYGPARDKVRAHFVSIPPSRLSFPLTAVDWAALKVPVVYLGMTAVSRDGQESDLSEIVFFLP